MTQGFIERSFIPTLTGNGAPNMIPNYIGQEYIDLSNGSIYKASNILGVYNWAYIGKGSTSAFDKNTIPGLIAWYDAANSANLTLSGTNVTGWYDLSGNGNHMTIDGSSPSYVQDVQNGKAGIYFNGINQALKNTTSITDVAMPYTVILCVRPTNWGTGTYQTISGYTYGIYDYAIIGKQTGSTVLRAASGSTVNGPTLSNGTTCTIAVVFNGTSSQIWLNNSLSSSGNAGGNNLVEANIGHLLTGTQWWEGYGFEQFYYSGALSSTDLNKIFTYLNNKWGVY